MKIRLVVAEFFFTASGRTEMKNLIVDFRSFLNAPRNCFDLLRVEGK